MPRTTAVGGITGDIRENTVFPAARARIGWRWTLQGMPAFSAFPEGFNVFFVIFAHDMHLCSIR